MALHDELNALEAEPDVVEKGKVILMGKTAPWNSKVKVTSLSNSPGISISLG